MSLKHATLVVVVCVGISILGRMLSIVAQGNPSMYHFVRSGLPSYIFLLKDVSLMVFFVFLLKNQR